MPVVMLRRDWPANGFRRVVRDKAGKPVEPARVLEFMPGVATEVDYSDMHAIAQDVKIGTIEINQHLKVEKAVKAEAEPAQEAPAESPAVSSDTASVLAKAIGPSELPPTTNPHSERHGKHRR